MKLFWKYYSVLFLGIIISNAYQLFDHNGVLGTYYNTTIVFNKLYVIPYLLNIADVLVSSIAAVYIFGYAFDLKILPQAPCWLFFLRLISDATGHSYDCQSIQAAFAQSQLVGSIALTSLVLPLLPSYILQFQITFKRK